MICECTENGTLLLSCASFCCCRFKQKLSSEDEPAAVHYLDCFTPTDGKKSSGSASENTAVRLMMTLSIVLVSFSRHCCGCRPPVFGHCLSPLCPMSTDGNSEIPEEVVLPPVLQIGRFTDILPKPISLLSC